MKRTYAVRRSRRVVAIPVIAIGGALGILICLLVLPTLVSDQTPTKGLTIAANPAEPSQFQTAIAARAINIVIGEDPTPAQKIGIGRQALVDISFDITVPSRTPSGDWDWEVALNHPIAVERSAETSDSRTGIVHYSNWTAPSTEFDSTLIRPLRLHPYPASDSTLLRYDLELKLQAPTTSQIVTYSGHPTQTWSVTWLPEPVPVKWFVVDYNPLTTYPPGTVTNSKVEYGKVLIQVSANSGLMAGSGSTLAQNGAKEWSATTAQGIQTETTTGWEPFAFFSEWAVWLIVTLLAAVVGGLYTQLVYPKDPPSQSMQPSTSSNEAM